MWPPLPKTNQSLSWQTSRSYAPSENVFCFLRSGKHFLPFPCAITFSNPLCYCHHCHCTTTTIDIEANGVLPSMNHGRCWEGAALESDKAARALVPRLSFFLFIFYYHSFTPTRLWFASNRANLASIGLYRLATETAKIGRNRPWIMPEQPKLALNEAQTS